MFARPGRILLIAGAAALLLLLGGGALVGLYTDALWFDSVGYGSVFWTRFTAKLAIVAVAGALAAGAVFLNLWFVLRHIGPVRLRRRYGNIEIAEEIRHGYLLGGAAGIAALAGWWLSALAFESGAALAVLAWLRSAAWGSADPLFGHDLSFYVFSLPVFFDLIDFLLVVLAWSFALAVLAYVIAGSVRWNDGRPIVAEHARMHLVLLVALGVLAFGARYWLGRYGLLFDGTGIGAGLGYTDVTARLPAHRILAGLSVLCAGGLLYGAWRRSWTPAFLAVGTLCVATVGIGHIYPAVVQRFRVEPNELAREAPYIDWNMDYTRSAYGLDALERRGFAPRDDARPDWDALESYLAGLTLWDADPLRTAYNQRQSLFGYYRFSNVDFDRYTHVNGPVQVAVSVREFDVEGLPETSRTWQSLRLNPRYLRGSGAVVTPVSATTGDGEPLLWLANLEPVTVAPDAPTGLHLTNPDVYIGETSLEYAVLIPGRDGEFTGEPGRDYPAGIELDSFARLLALGWRFREKNLLFSGEITDDSRFLFRRSVHARLGTIAPFLYWDPDPQPVVFDGRIVWIVDGYTTAPTYPLSRPVFVEGAGDVRYLRGSVKAVVDAVTGETRLYAIDRADPVLETYGRIFPELFRPLDEMPAALRSHLRYPSLLLRLQADILEEYHLERVDRFYSGQDVWQLPQRQGSNGLPRPYSPTYAMLRMPGSDTPAEFLLTMPFIARERQNMTAVLVARSDPPNYGDLVLLELPRDEQIPGPRQIETIIEQDPEIASQLSLWRRAGSNVEFGHLRIVPLDSMLLYVEPLYLSAREGAIPELQRVVVSNGRAVRMARTLAEGIDALAGMADDAAESADDAPTTLEPGFIEQWPSRALELLEDAERRLRNGDWSGFGSRWQELRELLRGLAGGSPEG